MAVDEKQKLLIEGLLNDEETFIKCIGIIDPEYFEPPFDRVVSYIKNHYNEYVSRPNLRIVKAETDVEFDTYTLHDDEREYVVDQIEEHCKLQAMINAVLTAGDMVEEGNPSGIIEVIREAMTVKIDKSLGTDLFDNPIQRIEQSEVSAERRTTGYDDFDKLIGYLKRGTTTMICAPTGGGKSLMLANLTNNMANQGLDCVIFSLELNENFVGNRMDSIVTGVPKRDILAHKDEVEQAYNNLQSRYGNIKIKKLPVGATAEDMMTYLQEYRIFNKRYPDVVVADYLDIMEPVRMSNKDNAFDRDKKIAEQFVRVIEEVDAYGLTASQLNRDAEEIESPGRKHIAGGLSKLNTVDNAVYQTQSEDQADSNEYSYGGMKIRDSDSPNHKFTLFMNPKTLKITQTPPTNKTSAGSTLSSNNKQTNVKKKLDKLSL